MFSAGGLPYAQRSTATIVWRSVGEPTRELDDCNAFLEPIIANEEGRRLLLLDDAYFEALQTARVLIAALPASSSSNHASSVWNNSMKQRLTPNCNHEEFADPTCAGLIDIFEDAWKGYVLDHVEMLLRNPNGDIAAMTFLCSCSESIEALHRGKSSDHQPREFLVRHIAGLHSEPNRPEHPREFPADSIAADKPGLYSWWADAEK